MTETFEWLQPISEETFRKKYMINGEDTVDDVLSGVAKEVSSVEKGKKKKVWGKKFHDELSSGRLIPAGRILANARPNSKMPYYNNCYTIGIEDSIEGIGESLKEDLIISATGGGVGINFSNLRPKDAPLSKGGESSGALSFMKSFNQNATVIHTGGSRRAAHIAILNCDHPEIEAFITAKQGDGNRALTQFNISVGVYDRFIEAVENDEDWDLQFEGVVYKTIKAKYLYELMTKNAFTHNEPGILNLDTINKYNNGWYGFTIQEVNPCFTGDTIVAVADGRNGVSIQELAERNEEFRVYSGKLKGKGNPKGSSKWKPEIKNATAFKTGDRKVIEVFLSNGTSFKCTPEHMLARPDGSYIEAQNSVGIELENFYTFSNKMTAKSYRTINSKTNGYNRQYRMMWEFENGEYNGKTHNIDHINEDSTEDFLSNLQLLDIETHKVKLKDSMLENNPINRMK
jgi:ribonucleotide reductase alpha subunit